MIEHTIGAVGRKSSKTLRRKVRESEILHSVLRYLELHRDVAWVKRMNSGAYKTGSRYVRFGFVGCSDIIGQLKDGRFLAIETKVPDGLVSADQRNFLQRVKHFGGVSGIARSVDDVNGILA